MSVGISDLDDAQRVAIYQYYIGWFVALVIILLIVRRILGVGSSQSSSGAARPAYNNDFLKFQRLYLVVYLLMMAADWLQGPYVYALYNHYGFSRSDIATLFVVGFASSFVFGTVVGSAADKYGRKRLCILFGILYGASCLTKHVQNFHVLLLGRLLGGISTSILFSSFESWMVSEHHAQQYPDEWLGATFSACTTGNGLVAIGSGVVASVVREQWGVVAPFDTSLVCLVLGSLIVALYWKENTGDASIDLSATLSNAVTKLRSDRRVQLLGVIQSFFEGCMYIFVFMWTPALEETSHFEKQVVSHGWIFACFMISVLIGSSLFQHLIERGYRIERSTLWMFLAAGAALLFAAFVPNHSARLGAFCVFEVCVGLFWPSLGFLRSKYVPEDCRATTMNLFRMPLNLIVVLVLANIGSLTNLQVFLLCVAVLLPALVCQWLLLRSELAEEAASGGLYGKVAASEPEGDAASVPLHDLRNVDVDVDVDLDASPLPTPPPSEGHSP